MNDFTKGEWIAEWNGYYMDVKLEHNSIASTFENEYTVEPVTKEQSVSNAQLIATAGTTATKLAEQGYDAVKVLELLPVVMVLLARCQSLLGDGLTSNQISELMDEIKAKADGGTNE